MDITYNEIENGLELTSICSDDEIIEIPDKIDGKNVVSIDFFAFECENAKKVIFPKTLEILNPTNFQDNDTIEEINIFATKIKKLDEQVFANCSNLQNVILPSSLEILQKTFQNCPKLKNVDIPDSVHTLIEPFIDSKLEKFAIGKNVNELKIGANFVCDNIVISPDNKEFECIDNIIYSKDKTRIIFAPKNLDVVKLPDETIYIDDKVFMNANITSLDLNNVTTVGKSCFENANIEKFIANKLQKVSSKSFKGLHTNYIEIKDLKYIDEGIFANSSIDTLKLSDDITTICAQAFFKANIKEFTCPESLTLIDEYAFADSTLENIKFNNKLKEIGKGAFDNCLKNAEIFLPKSLKVLGPHAFTYSSDALYHLNKNIEYNDGIRLNGETICPNILLSITNEEKDAFFAGTNLEGVSLGTIKTLEELLADGVPFKKANQIAQMLKEER